MEKQEESEQDLEEEQEEIEEKESKQEESEESDFEDPQFSESTPLRSTNGFNVHGLDASEIHVQQEQLEQAIESAPSSSIPEDSSSMDYSSNLSEYASHKARQYAQQQSAIEDSNRGLHFERIQGTNSLGNTHGQMQQQTRMPGSTISPEDMQAFQAEQRKYQEDMQNQSRLPFERKARDTRVR